MATIIEMPKLSDTMSEGKILTWLKHEGDEVEAGEVLAEIESDKANMELPAYEAGFLRKVLVAEGSSAPVGAAITPPVTVRIEDAQGNLTGSTALVGMALAANPGGGALAGTTSVAAVAGVATFGALSVTAGGAGYTLASGSSSCAAASAAVRNGHCDHGRVTVRMPGGDLVVDVRRDWSLRLEGPVEEVYRGALTDEFVDAWVTPP